MKYVPKNMERNWASWVIVTVDSEGHAEIREFEAHGDAREELERVVAEGRFSVYECQVTMAYRKTDVGKQF